jgi:hypothetical protein
VVSWGYESAQPISSQFIDYHEWQGTRDLAAFLTVPRRGLPKASCFNSREALRYSQHLENVTRHRMEWKWQVEFFYPLSIRRLAVRLRTESTKQPL